MDRIGKLRNLLQESPDDSFLKHALALELIKLGKDEDAAALFNEIVEHEADYVGTYYHLAKLHERNGRFDRAVEIYRKGIEVAGRLADNHARNELRMALDDLEEEQSDD